MTGQKDGQAESVCWLDTDERATWMVLVALMTKLPATLDAHLQREVGLTFFEYTVLTMLSERPQRSVRMSDLAALANGSLSRLSHVVKRLEQKGLIARSVDPTDGRFTQATLTKEGWNLVRLTAPKHVTHVRSTIFDHLTKQQSNDLRTACTKVLAHLDPEAMRTLSAINVALGT